MEIMFSHSLNNTDAPARTHPNGIPPTPDQLPQAVLPRTPRRLMSPWLKGLVGPETVTKPYPITVCIAAIAFIIFMIFAGIVIGFPGPFMHIAFGVIWAVIFVVVGIVATLDISRNRTRPYRRNLGNTVLNVLFTIPALTLLYTFLWYPSLNTDVLEFSEDMVKEAQFPSVALFQQVGWTGQANLLSGGKSKCFIGWYGDGLPQCSDMTGEEISLSSHCNCTNLWPRNVVEGFVWQNTTYRYLSFSTPSTFISRTPTTIMLLQVFFNYNAEAAINTSSSTPNPSLWLALYDPKLGISEALEAGYTTLNLINANGISAINLGLTYRKQFGREPAYAYDLAISSMPSLDLPCDVSKPQFQPYPCYSTLVVQIPNFNRRKIIEKKVMNWKDIAASAGAYYSFVQLMAWMVSGQMLAS